MAMGITGTGWCPVHGLARVRIGRCNGLQSGTPDIYVTAQQHACGADYAGFHNSNPALNTLISHEPD